MIEPTTDKFETFTPFPFVGKCYLMPFGDWTMHLCFISATSARITSVTTGDSEEVAILIMPLCPELSLIHWIEQDGTIVMLVLNIQSKTAHTITTLHRSVTRRLARFREVRPS